MKLSTILFSRLAYEVVPSNDPRIAEVDKYLHG